MSDWEEVAALKQLTPSLLHSLNEAQRCTTLFLSALHNGDFRAVLRQLNSLVDILDSSLSISRELRSYARRIVLAPYNTSPYDEVIDID